MLVVNLGQQYRAPGIPVTHNSTAYWKYCLDYVVRRCQPPFLTYEYAHEDILRPLPRCPWKLVNVLQPMEQAEA